MEKLIDNFGVERKRRRGNFKGRKMGKKKAKSDSKLYFLCFCVAIKIIEICLFFSLNFSKIKNDNIFPISNHIKN